METLIAVTEEREEETDFVAEEDVDENSDDEKQKEGNWRRESLAKKPVSLTPNTRQGV